MLSVGIIKRAFEEAEKSTYKFKLGAVVFKGPRIISSGHNGLIQGGISPKYKKYQNTIHAEQDALCGIPWGNLKGTSLLVIKVSKAKQILSNAKPCDMCMGLIRYVGIKNVYYSNENGEIVMMKTKEEL